MSKSKPVLGILGAGKLGTVLAQLAIKAGYTVYIAGSGSADKIALSVKIITPGAIAVTTEMAISKSDVVILALPLSKYKSLPRKLLGNKLVIDAMNYWWEVDGTIQELDTSPSSSEMVQSFLRESRVSKALSHMGYHHLLDDALPANAPHRKGIAIAGDNENDNATIAAIVSDLGFDSVIIGPLSSGKKLEPGNPLFGASVSADEIRKLI